MRRIIVFAVILNLIFYPVISNAQDLLGNIANSVKTNDISESFLRDVTGTTNSNVSIGDLQQDTSTSDYVEGFAYKMRQPDLNEIEEMSKNIKTGNCQEVEECVRYETVKLKGGRTSCRVFYDKYKPGCARNPERPECITNDCGRLFEMCEVEDYFPFASIRDKINGRIQEIAPGSNKYALRKTLIPQQYLVDCGWDFPVRCSVGTKWENCNRLFKKYPSCKIIKMGAFDVNYRAAKPVVFNETTLGFKGRRFINKYRNDTIDYVRELKEDGYQISYFLIPYLNYSHLEGDPFSGIKVGIYLMSCPAGEIKVCKETRKKVVCNDGIDTASLMTKAQSGIKMKENDYSEEFVQAFGLAQAANELRYIWSGESQMCEDGMWWILDMGLGNYIKSRLMSMAIGYIAGKIGKKLMGKLMKAGLGKYLNNGFLCTASLFNTVYNLTSKAKSVSSKGGETSGPPPAPNLYLSPKETDSETIELMTEVIERDKPEVYEWGGYWGVDYSTFVGETSSTHEIVKDINYGRDFSDLVDQNKIIYDVGQKLGKDSKIYVTYKVADLEKGTIETKEIDASRGSQGCLKAVGAKAASFISNIAGIDPASALDAMNTVTNFLGNPIVQMTIGMAIDIATSIDHCSTCDDEQCAIEHNDYKIYTLKKNGLCHYVGSACSKEFKFLFFKKCIRTGYRYCCYNSKLTRILVEGAYSQLGYGWGDFYSPNCNGIRFEDLKKLDFSAMDLSEFTNEIEARMDKSIDKINWEDIVRASMAY